MSKDGRRGCSSTPGEEDKEAAIAPRDGYPKRKLIGRHPASHDTRASRRSRAELPRRDGVREM